MRLISRPGGRKKKKQRGGGVLALTREAAPDEGGEGFGTLLTVDTHPTLCPPNFHSPPPLGSYPLSYLHRYSVSPS